MNFSSIENFHKKWSDIRVIGKTIERDGSKYHIIGMTLSDEAKLYIIGPYIEPEVTNQKGSRPRRKILKEPDRNGCCYLHCREFCFDSERLEIQGGSGSSLKYAAADYGVLQLFFDMMSAGWIVPDWLKDTDWDDLQLVTLDIAHVEKLPEYSPEMPITIIHRPDPRRHILEKTVTLNVGKCRSLSFTDAYGEQVQCYINNVTLIDVWQDTQKQFNDPKLTERFSPEQLEQAKKYSYDALMQTCPKGMCYIGIEYECTKDLNLVFHSKEYLRSRPEVHQGSAVFFLMRLKPDRETGTHGLPLKGCVIQTPVSPDTRRIPAELFQYFEKTDEWTEIVS